MMTLLLPPALPSIVLALHSPPNALSFQRPIPIPIPIPIPSHHQHHRILRTIPTRPCASLPSKEERVVSILSVLRSHDIPEDACTAIVSTWPDRFLRMKPLKNLDPKLQFLRSSAGLSGAEVAEILLANPYLLRSRLHPRLSSFVNFLASILPSKKDLVRVLKSVLCYHTDRIKANIQALRDVGVEESVVHKILRHYPRSFVGSTEKFAATLEAIEKVGLCPTNRIFEVAVRQAPYMTKATLLSKVDLFKELGWSEELVFSMSRKQPQFLSLSDALLRKKLEYYEEVLGWGSEIISANPAIMTLSLEKRITLRCAVLNVLIMEGLLERRKRTWCPWRFTMPEVRFFADYVDRYKEEVPEVLEAYLGNIEFTGWGWLKDVRRGGGGGGGEEEAVVTKGL